MAKVRINGEYFEFDFTSQPLSEMLALEKALGVTYGQWSSDRQAGSARALAGQIWLIWRRNGRDVEFADIESGAVEINLADSYMEGGGEDAGEDPDPTTSPSGQEASSTTAGSTSARSRKS